MSSETPSVVLPGPAMVPLVRALAALDVASMPPVAVIGGVAVAVRLGRIVRATSDVDVVTHARVAPTAIEVLRRQADAAYDHTRPHTVVVAGSQIEFQDVEPVTDDELVGLADADLLYIAAHVHALAAATPVRIVAVAPDAQVEAMVPVATPAALLGTKLHAYVDRRPSTAMDKRPGDVWDLYHLLVHVGDAAAAELATAQEPLRRVVASMISAHLVDGAVRARSILRSSGDERYHAITVEDLAFAAATFLDRIVRSESAS